MASTRHDFRDIVTLFQGSVLYRSEDGSPAASGETFRDN